jgi:hypothetical protein
MIMVGWLPTYDDMDEGDVCSGSDRLGSWVGTEYISRHLVKLYTDLLLQFINIVE